MERAGMGRVRVLSLLGYFWSVATDNLDVICSELITNLRVYFCHCCYGFLFTYSTIDLLQPNLAGDLTFHNQHGCILTYCIFCRISFAIPLCSCRVF